MKNSAGNHSRDSEDVCTGHNRELLEPVQKFEMKIMIYVNVLLRVYLLLYLRGPLVSGRRDNFFSPLTGEKAKFNLYLYNNIDRDFVGFRCHRAILQMRVVYERYY